MKYWDDFFNRDGFNCGDDTPSEAWAFRDLYVDAINLIADELNYTTRAVATSSDGNHNGCMIKLEDSTELEEESIYDILDAVDLDAYVEVRPVVDPKWRYEVIKQTKEQTK